MPAVLGPTFAERRAASRARAARPRLVSLGKNYYPRHTRSGPELVEAELFYEVDKPNRRYIQFPGPGGRAPLFDNSSSREDVQQLRPLGPHGFGRPGGAFEPSPPDAVRVLEPAPRGRLARPEVSAHPDAVPEQPPRPVV
jgi:hypothetical protein